MGKPTISKFGVTAYVDGSDLIINDANILSEIGGNLESRANIANFNNYFTATYSWKKNNLLSYTFGQYSFMGVLNLPKKFTVFKAEFIGYADQDAANRNFADSPTNANASNKVQCRIRHLDSLTGNAIPFQVASSTLPEHTVELTEGGVPKSIGNVASSSPINLLVSPNQVFEISLKIDASANANFDPSVQVTLFCGMEHGK
tara:strand:- start:937 stop:1542 length:606 start_codon:yes stop_codon:yes gene_type:complete